MNLKKLSHDLCTHTGHRQDFYDQYSDKLLHVKDISHEGYQTSVHSAKTVKFYSHAYLPRSVW